ncbi:MAG: Ig domain-containing protein [Deltaproteobacteria bacterium]|nr:Ig domain-containing protein [Deltaproteobacteria bacterium]
MTRSLACTALLAAALACTAGRAAATSVGTLDNFDVVNDTPGPCHGFEIELEDIHPADVPYTFGGSYIRYGAPEVLDTTVDPAHPRVLVRYRAWNGSQWEATPVAPPNVSPQGHDCYSSGPIGNYLDSGCEHFGVSLSATPTRTTYRWLVAADPADVNSAFTNVPQTVNLPVPVFSVAPAPPAAGGGVAVRAEVEPVDEQNPSQFGEPQWLKVFKIETEQHLQPEDLVKLLLGAPGNVLPDETEIETEWKLIQSKPGNAEGEQEDADVKEDHLAAGKRGVVRRYEFYRYNGPRDAENNEALPCVNDDSPVPADQPVEGCSDLGDFVGAQNVAVDVDLSVAVDVLPTGEVGVAYAPIAVVIGGLTPYTVDASGVPGGLMLDAASGVLSGTPSEAGEFSLAVDATDSASDRVQGTLGLSIAPALAFASDALPDATAGECYAAAAELSGGVPPFTWDEIHRDLPAWAATTDNSDVSGCPTAADVGTTEIRFAVTDGLGATADRTLTLTVRGPLPTCAGSCNGDAQVSIDELITLVNIALGSQPSESCADGIPSGAQVDIAFLVGAVGHALQGCPA